MTECVQETFSYAALFPRRAAVGFTAGQVSNDRGALLSRQAHRKINLLGGPAGRLHVQPNAWPVEAMPSSLGACSSIGFPNR